MSEREEFSRKTRELAFERAGGRCEHCGIVFRDGMRKEYDHITTDFHGGGNGLDNCQVLCQNCHGAKTKDDKPKIAKSRRMIKVGAGLRAKVPKGQPLAGTKRSGIKKSVNGAVYRR